MNAIECLTPEEQSVVELREKIDRLEAVMFQMKEHHIHIEPVHYFSDGFYAREITIPKGCTLTGKIHKFEHINVISKGAISVMTDEGIKLITAPCTIVSKPGTKRVGFAHEETVWTTFHRTEETDVEKIEDALVVCTRDQFLEFEQNRLGGN